MSLLESEGGVAVQIRLRRTSIEYGYVRVEVTPDLIGSDNRIDSAKLFQRAVEWGQEPQMIWYKEEQIVEPHPIQGPHEQHEKALYKSQNGFEVY